MKSFRTIPEMLLNRASQHANACVANDRLAEGWTHVSTSELIRRIATLAAALNRRISVRGVCAGILAPPSASWLVADMAIMLAGGVPVPFFVDFSDAHFQHKVDDANIRTIFIFGAPLWERFLPFAERFDLVVTDQSTGNLPNAIQVDELHAEGTARLDKEPGLIQHMLDQINPADLALIIYTSGSTGQPKGVELTHRNLVAQLHDIEPLFPIRPCKDRALSLLPLAHCFERIVIYLYLARGISIYFVDEVEHLGMLLQDVRPTMMTVVPRLLEKTYGRIAQKSELVFGPLGGLARWTWRHASRQDGEISLSNTLSDRLVGWQVRKAFGGKLRTMVVGGAHMPDDLNRFFVRMGVPLYEGYGLTEAAPVVCVNHPGARKLGTVGRPLQSVQVKLTDEGEVLARGPNIMRGYHNLPDETARVIDAEGWLHTGDMGQFDADGYLRIVARRKELFKTSTGEIVCPQPIEQALCRSEWIETACVIAESRRFASCLLFMDRDALARLKHRCGESHRTDADFLASSALHHEIRNLIQQVNTDLDHWEKIHGYALLLEPPTIENGQLTPTLKIRRHTVEEHYQALIRQLYDETKKREDSNEYAIGHC